MIPHELSKSDIVKIIKQLDKLSPSFPLDFTLQKACLAKRRSEHSYKRAPSYMDVANAFSLHHFRIPHDHTVSRAPSEHLLPFSLDFTLQKACLAKRRSEHSYKRAPSYTDVASMKLKQDVESSW